MIDVCVSTLVFGKGGIETPLPPVVLHLASQHVTVRDIIARAVDEQFKKLSDTYADDHVQIRRQFVRQYLDDNEIACQATVGKIAIASTTPAQPHINTETERALRAFQQGRYKVFVDGIEAVDLDETHALTKGTSITFIRLIPLVGG